MITENTKGMDALLRSKKYIEGKWWIVFRRILFIVALYTLSLSPMSFIFGILKIPFASAISNFIVGSLLMPLFTTYMFLIYSDLKTIKGEIAFVPTKYKNREKKAFIFVGILGFILVLIVSFSTILSYKKEMQDATIKANPSSLKFQNSNNALTIKFIKQVVQNVEFIKEAVQRQKRYLPIQIDQNTKFVNITAEPNAIRYYFMLSNINTNKETSDLLKSKFLLLEDCQNINTLKMLDRGINLEALYSVKNSTKEYFFRITKADCD